MKLNKLFKHNWYKTLTVLSVCSGLAATILSPSVFANEPTTTTSDKPVVETKHIHVPFVHIDIEKHPDGTKDYDVKAPFTTVHNPAGADNAQVKAPFYKVDYAPRKTVSTSKTPTTH